MDNNTSNQGFQSRGKRSTDHIFDFLKTDLEHFLGWIQHWSRPSTSTLWFWKAINWLMNSFYALMSDILCVIIQSYSQILRSVRIFFYSKRIDCISYKTGNNFNPFIMTIISFFKSIGLQKPALFVWKFLFNFSKFFTRIRHKIISINNHQPITKSSLVLWNVEIFSLLEQVSNFTFWV